MIEAAQREKPDIPGDFGFYNPQDYVYSRAPLTLDSGLLPKPGGLDDQDDDYIADLYTYARLRAYALWAARKPENLMLAMQEIEQTYTPRLKKRARLSDL